MVLDEWGELAGHKRYLTHHTQISRLGIQCHPGTYLTIDEHVSLVFFNLFVCDSILIFPIFTFSKPLWLYTFELSKPFRLYIF